MSARVTRKRARVEAEQAAQDIGTAGSLEAATTSGPVDFQRDAELWIEDGTISLVAGGVGFKVYKGPLVDHSPVFKDMFSLPQPMTAAVQHCPIIPLADSPADLRHVLPLLMPSKRIRLNTVQSTTAPAVFACIRIAHKYQIDHLVEESLNYLRKSYPRTFDLFSKRTKVLKPDVGPIVVNLARLTGAHDLLPLALADCCRLGPALVDGILQPDGTREHLSPADLALCIRAKDKLIEARVQAFAGMFDALENDGEECEADKEDFETVRKELLDGTLSGLCSANVWDSLATRVLKRIPEICKGCRKAVTSAEQEQRKAIFERLPDLVGVAVEGWGKVASSRR